MAGVSKGEGADTARDAGLDRLRRERARMDAQETAPRARLERLVDPGTFLELGRLTRSQQASARDDTPGDGLLAGWARVAGREVGVVAEDPLVLARTDGQVARNKLLRVLNTSAIRGNPVIVLADGPEAGPASFPPASGELFGFMARQWKEPSAGDFAAPMVTVVHGWCSGRTAELALASDVVVATAAGRVGGLSDAPELIDASVDDDEAALNTVRRLFELLPDGDGPLPSTGPSTAARPLTDALVPHPPVDEVLDGLFDRESVVRFHERPGFRTGVARLDGFPVAFAATAGPSVVGSADLAGLRRVAGLSGRCRIPLVLVQDTDGYDPAEAATARFLRELGGALDAVRSTPAPKLCLVVGHGHVQGTFALGGRQLGMDLVAALPFARVVPLNVPTYAPGAVPEGDDGPWLAAGLGHVDEVVAPGEARGYLGTALAVLAGGRALPTPDAQRAGRYVDDIPKV